MKKETINYILSLLQNDLGNKRAELNRVLLQGMEGKRELELYKCSLCAYTEFSILAEE